MPLSTEQINDLEQYKSLSTHIVSILDNEARIDSSMRQVTEANITALNDLYTNVIQAIEDTITPVV